MAESWSGGHADDGRIDWGTDRMAQPRYTLITGEFYIRYPDLPQNGPEPDGDTVNFLPDQDSLIQNLQRFGTVGPDRRHLGTYGVRFEGIDTLETHFPDHRFHQNLEFAAKARDRVLAQLGFGAVTFLSGNKRNKIDAAEHHPVPGYLFADGIESNGRVLGIVYPGDPPASLSAGDGDRVFVTPQLIDSSINAQQIRDGLAYGELYDTMPIDLVNHLAQAVKTARTGGQGFWPAENVGVNKESTIPTIAPLSDLVMFPKLYRRLVKYFLEQPDHGLVGFDTWVRADGKDRDDRLILPNRELGNLHDIYAINGDNLELTVLPEDLIFLPDPV